MPVLTGVQLAAIMPHAPAAPPDWLLLLNGAMQEFEIATSAVRMAAFLAQIAHESKEMTLRIEHLNYSASGLRKTWPNRFTSDEMAQRFAKRQEDIANFVYSNRLGNGDSASGDGWRFRGRGLIQITGRANYRSVGTALQLPLEREPEIAEQPAVAVRTAGHFWRSNGLNELSDVSGDQVHDDEDFERITKVINGGTAGFKERIQYWNAAKAQLLG